MATSVAAARALSDAARDVASVVFFTDRFATDSPRWFEVGDRGRQGPCMPFGARRSGQSARPRLGDPHGLALERDPHAFSTLWAALGPVAEVTATAGKGDLIHMVLRHEDGSTSTVTLTQFAPPAAETYDVTLWGESGFSTMPPRPVSFGEPLAVAARELVAAATSGRPHEVDVRFGTRVVELVAAAQAQLA